MIEVEPNKNLEDWTLDLRNQISSIRKEIEYNRTHKKSRLHKFIIGYWIPLIFTSISIILIIRVFTQ